MKNQNSISSYVTIGCLLILLAIVLFLPYSAFSQHDSGVLSQPITVNHQQVLIDEFWVKIAGLLLLASQTLGKVFGEFLYSYTRIVFNDWLENRNSKNSLRMSDNNEKPKDNEKTEPT